MLAEYLKGKLKSTRWRVACLVLAVDLTWLLLIDLVTRTLSADDLLSNTPRTQIASVLSKAWAAAHAPVVSLAVGSGLIPTTFDDGALYMESRLLLFYFVSMGYAFAVGFACGLVLEWLGSRRTPK
jgi:hypothetical protein